MTLPLQHPQPPTTTLNKSAAPLLPQQKTVHLKTKHQRRFLFSVRQAVRAGRGKRKSPPSPAAALLFVLED